MHGSGRGWGRAKQDVYAQARVKASDGIQQAFHSKIINIVVWGVCIAACGKWEAGMPCGWKATVLYAALVLEAMQICYGIVKSLLIVLLIMPTA